MDTIVPKKIQETIHTLEKQILALESADALRNIRQALYDIGANIEALIGELEGKIQTKKTQPYFTIKEVAELFSVSTVTVYKWINDGLLEPLPATGSKIRITQEAIDQYIELNKKMRSDPAFRKRIKDRIEARNKLRNKKK
jgi:excisionase family DNA binding protein